MSARLTRQYVFRALHCLENRALDPAANERLYGMCYRQHGHHYKVQVTVEGSIDPNTGLCCDRDLLDQIVNKYLIEPFDGQDLNALFSNTAGEALAYEFYQLLAPHLAPMKLSKVGIQETRKNWFEYSAELQTGYNF